MGAIRANDFPCRTNGFGQTDRDHASSRTVPDGAERLTGIYGSDGGAMARKLLPRRFRSSGRRPCGPGRLAIGRRGCAERVSVAVVQRRSTATSPHNRQPAQPPAHPASSDDSKTPSTAASSGRRGRRFKSGHPDPGHRPLAIFAGGLSRALSDYDCESAAGRLAFFTTAYFHHLDGLAGSDETGAPTLSGGDVGRA